MADKVTLRLEQFDTVQSGDISVSGPIEVFASVNAVTDLTSLEDLYDGAVAYVKNVTNESSNLKYRGAYFSYRELTDTWQEILLGTHSHENKEFLDRLGGVDFGEWVELTDNSNVFIQSTKPTTGLTDKALFLSTVNETLEVYDALAATWTNITSKLSVTENYFPSVPKIGDYVYYEDTTLETPEFRFYIFYPIQKNEKKIFTLEVIDTDNTEATYEYNLNWQDLPEFNIPTIPTEGDKYLSYNSDKQLEWKNNFIAAQTFQIKTVKVLETGLTVSFDDVLFDSTLDDALVLVGKFFIYNRTLSYNSNTKVLTVTLTSDPDSDGEVAQFEQDETVSILIIRNGAASVLDTLAADYVTKSEAITLLSGGSVNLKDYLTKQDGLQFAKKYHTHSQFSRVGHDHDNRYAMFHHTHSEYLTRRAAIALIEEQLTLHPDILTTLTAISDAIANNTTLQEFIENLATATANISDIQASIDAINDNFDNYYTKTQIDSMLANEKFRSDQVDVIMDTESEAFNDLFRTPEGQPKDLTQVLAELRTDLDSDYGNIHSDEVFIKEDIPVLLGDGFEGDFETGDTASTTENIQQILTRILQRRIVPTYSAGTMSTSFSLPSLPEIGEEIDVVITSSFTRNNSGLLNKYEVVKTVDSVDEILHSTSSIVSPLTKSVAVSNLPTTLAVYGSYLDGEPLFDNIDTYYERFDEEYEVPGKITAGDTNITYLTITGRRALFYGSGVDDSAAIRSYNKLVLQSYDSFEVEYTMPADDRFVLFAIPAANSDGVTIHYKEQGNADITDMFTQTSMSVDSANGFDSAMYNVYSVFFTIASPVKMTFIFKK